MIDESLDVTAGENIRRLREQLGYSQAELARRVGGGFQQQTIVKIEKGARPLRLAEAVAVADALSVDVSDLYRTGRGYVAQLAGMVQRARILYDAILGYNVDLESLRLRMRDILGKVGDDLPPDLREAVRTWSRDDLLDSCIGDARNSSSVQILRKALTDGKGTVQLTAQLDPDEPARQAKRSSSRKAD